MLHFLSLISFSIDKLFDTIFSLQFTQGTYSVAIGVSAGRGSQGASCVAIGVNAGITNQTADSICINANGTSFLNAPTTGLFIKPLRTSVTAAVTAAPIYYNSTTSELIYGANVTTAQQAAKTFVIDHPINPDKFLIHACLEGPEAGIYYRGKVIIPENSNTIKINLPDYVNKIGYYFTVNVTPIGKPRLFGASEVFQNSFDIYCLEGGMFHWVVYGKRGDINIEPYKETVNVKGNGPYRWI